MSYLQIKDDKGEVRYEWGASDEQKDICAEAIDRVNRVSTREELENVYNMYPNLHKDKTFIDACTKQAKKIQTAA